MIVVLSPNLVKEFPQGFAETAGVTTVCTHKDVVRLVGIQLALAVNKLKLSLMFCQAEVQGLTETP